MMAAMNTGPLTLDAATLTQLQAWVGNRETASDEITGAPLRALSATLDRDDPVPMRGTAVPPLWHWLYFLPQPRQSELGPDGHARRGGFLPPVPLPRRMWAGGRLKWRPENPLRVGDAVQRISCIESVTHKAGRSGDLLFVLVKHAVHNAQGLALTEEHDIVYRAAAPQAPTLGTGLSSLRPEGTLAPRGGPPVPAPHDDAVPPPIASETGATWQREVRPDDVLLFRYSALTFNGHRIHYDRKYVTEVEGYPGLIVHGPLIATLLVDLVRRHAPAAFIKRFDFKAVRDSMWGLALLVIIMGGIYGGIFTPTEAAAVSAVYALCVAVFIYKDLKLRDLPDVFLTSARTTVMLMFIVANALLFAHVLTTERIPQLIAEQIMAVGMTPWMFLAVVNVILLVTGNFMEPTGIILILAPILFPIATQLGIDPIHLGVIMVVNMEIGMVTPPVGLNLFVTSGVTGMNLVQVTRAALPWLSVLLVFLVIITYVPWISLVLPDLMFGK